MKRGWILRGLVLPGLLLGALFLLPRCRALTAADVLERLPSGPLPAAALLLALYVGKSLSFFFPLAVLEAAAGLLFPLPGALALNAAGIAAAMTVPWLLGRRERDGLDALIARHPRLGRVRAMRQGSDFLFVLLLRMAGLFPFDAVSLYLGAAGIPYSTALTAGLLGCLPHLVAVTVLGSALSLRSRRTLLLALAANAAVTAAAALVWALRRRRS